MLIFTSLEAIDLKRRSKNVYLNDVVTIFNTKILKYTLYLTLAIITIICFLMILLINSLAYLSILNISSSELINLSLWEIFLLWIFLILYIIIKDSKKKKEK